MFDKKIIFCASDKEWVNVWPHPKPASQVIPKEYKDLERFKHKNLFHPTLKTCMPFLDSLTAGYIIPFDQDYVITPVEDEFTITPASREPVDVSFHQNSQLPNLTKSHAGKFMNKWLIKTPPGYSCLFVKPMNRIENRFDIIPGIVDTDKYINLINFPFLLNKRDEQFVIKKGEPMVQLIPFKREPWKKWSGYYFEKLHGKTLKLVFTELIDRYKKHFWSKKSFK